MTTSSEIQSCLVFDREELREAISILAATLDPAESWMSIAFGGANARLSTDTSSYEVPASGHWEDVVFLSAGWLRAMNAALPDSNPIKLCLHDGKLHAGGYVTTCSSIPPKRLPSKTGIGEPEFRLRISEAAEVLRPYLVSEEKLKELVLFAEETRSPVWTLQETEMIWAVARAWNQLAVLGVETADLRRLLDESIRNAFPGSGDD